MWHTIERARRRLRRDDAGRDPIPGAPDAVAAVTAQTASADLTFALGRADLERLIGALTDGTEAERPDTPARLQAALNRAIGAVAGSGEPAVTRRPAGLYTPETWQIEVIGADGRTSLALEQAIRGEGTR